MKVVNSYADGTQETIVSDESWKVHRSPITFSSMYGGEDYHEQVLPTSWSTPDFDDTAWNNALVVDGPALRVQEAEPQPAQGDRARLDHARSPRRRTASRVGRAGGWRSAAPGSVVQACRRTGGSFLEAGRRRHRPIAVSRPTLPVTPGPHTGASCDRHHTRDVRRSGIAPHTTRLCSVPSGARPPGSTLSRHERQLAERRPPGGTYHFLLERLSRPRTRCSCRPTRPRSPGP